MPSPYPYSYSRSMWANRTHVMPQSGPAAITRAWWGTEQPGVPNFSYATDGAGNTHVISNIAYPEGGFVEPEQADPTAAPPPPWRTW